MLKLFLFIIQTMFNRNLCLLKCRSFSLVKSMYNSRGLIAVFNGSI